jgi:hypothetical protein
MRYRDDPVRVHSLARWLVASYGKGAEAIALAVVATLIDNGQLDYAELWQQVARFVGTLIGGGGA